MKGLYKINKTIKSSDVDAFNNIKLSSIFSDIQDIGTDAIEALGVTDEKTRDRGYYWVFTKVYIEFNRIPKYKEIITYETHTLDMVHFLYPRFFNVKDSKGNTIYKILLYCVLINKDKRSIALPKETGVVLNSTKHKDEDIIQMPNDKPTKEVSFRYKRVINYNDIDVNGHLNNVKYIESILSVLNVNFMKNNEIKSFEISFLKEALEGDEVSIYSSDDYTYFIGKVKDTKIFESRITYK